MENGNQDIIININEAIDNVKDILQPMVDDSLDDDIEFVIHIFQKEVISRLQLVSKLDKNFYSVLKFLSVSILGHFYGIAEGNPYYEFGEKVQQEIDNLNDEIKFLKIIKHYLKVVKKTKQYDELNNSFVAAIMIQGLWLNRSERIKIAAEVLNCRQKGITYFPNSIELGLVDSSYREFVENTVDVLQKIKKK